MGMGMGMGMPCERTRSIIHTGDFLRAHSKNPSVPSVGQPYFGQGLYRARLGIRNAQTENHVFPGALPWHQSGFRKNRSAFLGHQQLFAVDAIDQ